MRTEELHEILRDQFRDGASVAELVRTARQYLGGNTPTGELGAVVREAFHMSPGGWHVLSSTESFGNGSKPDSLLTWVFLRELLLERQNWDTPADGTARWYDGLKKTDSKVRHAVAEQTHGGLSAEGWAALDSKDRDVVRMIEATRLGLSEDVQILAALAERLQQRVNELKQLEHQQPV